MFYRDTSLGWPYPPLIYKVTPSQGTLAMPNHYRNALICKSGIPPLCFLATQEKEFHCIVLLTLFSSSTTALNSFRQIKN